MPPAARPADEEYIEIGYEDKVIFTPHKKAESGQNMLDIWRRSQGLWTDHPVFGGMDIKGAIEWLRGEECDA